MVLFARELAPFVFSADSHVEAIDFTLLYVSRNPEDPYHGKSPTYTENQ